MSLALYLARVRSSDLLGGGPRLFLTDFGADLEADPMSGNHQAIGCIVPECEAHRPIRFKVEGKQRSTRTATEVKQPLLRGERKRSGQRFDSRRFNLEFTGKERNEHWGIAHGIGVARLPWKDERKIFAATLDTIENRRSEIDDSFRGYQSTPPNV
jgi:hypothetical protein